PTLTWDDLKAIQTQVGTVAAAAPVLRTSSVVISEDQNWGTSIYGTTPEYFVVRSWPMASGAAITPSDVEGSAKIAVLGRTVVDKLYGPNADPVGQVVRIKNVPFQVVGVAASKGQSAMGQDYDDGVFIPVTTFQTKIQGGLQAYLNGTIMVAATASNTVSKA